MRRHVISRAATVAVAAIALTGFAGCAPKPDTGVGSTLVSVASGQINQKDLNINITKWRIGRGSWNVDTSHETGKSEGSLGDQQVLVAEITMTNRSNIETIISPIDEMAATQGDDTLQFGALYDSKGNFKNPEAKIVKPGQTVKGLAIWNIDDLNTPIKVSIKCGGGRTVTVVPAEDAE